MFGGENMKQKIWAEDEDNYIRRNFGNITFTEMAETLNCSITTVQRRAELLGIEFEKKTAKRWTEEEIALLKLMSTKYLNKTIAKKLNRSLQEVNKKARELGITLIFKRPVWKKWMIKYLKENINKISLAKIKKELDVNYFQIMEQLDELGLEYISNRWTEEEEQILIELAPKYYIREIAKLLNRSEGAVITKANKMGIEYITLSRKFSLEEIEYIKTNWGTIPVTEMARTLKVSRIMIQRQADIIGMPKLGNNPYRKWTDDEVEKLRKLGKKKTITELAKYFKTTNEAIQTVASRNCVDLIDEKVHWTDYDNLLLQEYAKTMDLLEIANKMNKSTSAVRLQAFRQGITIMQNKKHKDSIWTDENTEQLKELVSQEKSILEIAKIMNKKDQTLLKKAREMGISIKREENREWTKEDIKNLIILSRTKKMSELVSELGRTSSSINQKAKVLGITILQDRKSWTEEEYKQLEYLVMVEKKTPKEIADILGRTEDSIIIKINRRGLKIQTNDKRFWTEEEETLVSDLWGSEPIEKIAKRLNRTVSSVRNKAFQLGLGSQIESNYDGLKISTISELFNVRTEMVNIYWVALGLKVKTRNITQSTSYSYVEINDLLEFLENNQNIWDSRMLEKNILGKEPKWLKEKRITDNNYPIGSFGLESLTKQQLIVAKQFFLEHKQKIEENPISDEHSMQLVKRRKNIMDGDSNA